MGGAGTTEHWSGLTLTTGCCGQPDHARTSPSAANPVVPRVERVDDPHTMSIRDVPELGNVSLMTLMLQFRDGP